MKNKPTVKSTVNLLRGTTFCLFLLINNGPLSAQKEIPILQQYAHSAETPYHAAVSPDGARVALAGKHHIAYFSPSGALERQLPHPAQVTAIDRIKWSQDSKLLAVLCAPDLYIYDQKGALLRKFKAKHDELVTDFAWLTSRKEIVTCSKDSKLHYWNYETGLLSRSTTPPDSLQTDDFTLSVTADQKLLLTGSAEGKVRLWNTDGTFVRQYRSTQWNGLKATISPDGTYFAAYSLPGYQLWIQSLSKESEQVKVEIGNYPGDLLFAPDSRSVLSTSGKKDQVRQWNLKGQLLHTFPLEGQHCHDASFAPDGRWVVFAVEGSQALVCALDPQLTVRDLSNPSLTAKSGASELPDSEPEMAEAATSSSPPVIAKTLNIVLDKHTAGEYRRAENTPENAVAHFLASRIAGNNRWQQFIQYEADGTTPKVTDLDTWDEFKAISATLLEVIPNTDGLVRVKVDFRIELLKRNNYPLKMVDYFTCKRINGKWKIIACPG